MPQKEVTAPIDIFILNSLKHGETFVGNDTQYYLHETVRRLLGEYANKHIADKLDQWTHVTIGEFLTDEMAAGAIWMRDQLKGNVEK